MSSILQSVRPNPGDWPRAGILSVLKREPRRAPVHVPLAYRIGRGAASQVQRIRDRPERGDTDSDKQGCPDLVFFGVAVRGCGRSSHDDVNGVKQYDASSSASDDVTEDKKGIPKHGGSLRRLVDGNPSIGEPRRRRDIGARTLFIPKC